MAKGAYIGIPTMVAPKSLGTMTVGDIVKLKENGSPVDYLVVHQGNPDPSIYDASCNGTWLLRKDTYTRGIWDVTENYSYQFSSINSELSGFISRFDNQVFNVINEHKAKIPYGSGWGASTATIGAYGMEVSAFLLSCYEVGFDTSITSTAANEGALLDYFRYGTGSEANSKRIAYSGGVAVDWWLRSSYTKTGANAHFVSTSGACSYNSMFGSAYYRPALIMPSNMKISSDGLITGETSTKPVVTTKDVARKIKKGYVGVDGVAKRIKKAYIGIGGNVTYREVEYIQSSGTQYIDTEFKPNQDTRVVLDFHNSGDYSSNSSGLACLFGARHGTKVSAFCIWVGATSYPQYGSVSYNANGSFTTNINDRITYDFNKNVVTVGVETITCTTATFQTEYNLFLLDLNQAGTPNSRKVSGKLYSCQIYDNGTIVRDYVPVVDPNGVPGMFDRITKHFFANAGTGNFIAGEETGSTYISNGIARPVWSGGELAYYGEITSLSVAREGLAAARTQNRALFAGGYHFNGTTDGWSNAVDAYDKSLTRKTAPTLWYSVEECAGASVGNYAIFAGGYTGNDEVYYVNAYNDSLTLKNPDSLTRGRYEMGAASVGNYALFAGGTCTSDMWSYVDYYNKSLTHGAASNGLTVPRHMLTGASVGGYAIFAGGRESSGGYSAVADAYNSSLTRVTVPSLSDGRRDPAAATVGGYALFAGGEANSSVSMRVVDVYNESLTKTKATDLSNASKELAGTAIGECAIFAGGLNSIVDVYDTSLVKKLSTDFPTLRLGLAASTVGDFALFAGGRDNYAVTCASTYAYTLV